MEASWVVRTADGRAIADCACSDPQIVAVRFTLVGDSAPVSGLTPCSGRAECGFPCDRHTGATPFDIPPGSYLISLTPVNAAGEDLTQPGADRGQVETPAPVLREVVRGKPTQLDAFQLRAKCAQSCAGSNQSKVCSRE